MTRATDLQDLAEGIADEEASDLGTGDKMSMLLVAAVAGLVANWVATGTSPLEALPGMLVLLAASAAGLVLARTIRIGLPAVAWVSLLAVLVTIPGVPGAAWVAEAVGRLNFLALATPALAYGGLALTAQEFRIARTSGWKIVIVAICVMFGTYIGSVLIADLTLRVMG
ncbi:hypothetical protein [Paracoccus sp. (in: a-proteobacteria)]|uniref:hypothetical protein n=1 Tax=Paracoccus sp. TaxID=267 RepID=UPI0026DEA70D|nr:hypothetical protein [Paracoccus sp. (in: a-proteobacteria)]MDO5371202.1 hypothetical protein [Paracoccus sp. (in: a-proteobacteria)]